MFFMIYAYGSVNDKIIKLNGVRVNCTKFGSQMGAAGGGGGTNFHIILFSPSRKARRKDKEPSSSGGEDPKLYLEEAVLERKLQDIDLRVLVALPAGLDYNEWLASHSKYHVRFYADSRRSRLSRFTFFGDVSRRIFRKLVRWDPSPVV